MAEADTDATDMSEAEDIRDGRHHGNTPQKKRRARPSPPLCSSEQCTKSKMSGFEFCGEHGGGYRVFCVGCGTNVSGQDRKIGRGPDEDDATQLSFSCFLALAVGQFPVSGLERTPKRLCKACSAHVPKGYLATVVATSHPPLRGLPIKLGLPGLYYEKNALRKALAVLNKEYVAQDFGKINRRIAEMPINEDWTLLEFGESMKTGFPHSFTHAHLWPSTTPIPLNHSHTSAYTYLHSSGLVRRSFASNPDR